ncbi:MAG: hypothetical protein WCO12_03275 [bacterium]
MKIIITTPMAVFVDRSLINGSLSKTIFLKEDEYLLSEIQNPEKRDSAFIWYMIEKLGHVFAINPCFENPSFIIIP